MNRTKLRLVFLVSALTGVHPVVQAEDVPALIAQADAAYSQRDDVSQAKVAMLSYERAAAQDLSRTAECLWKASRTAWWLGEHGETRAERLSYYQKGIDLAKKVLALNPESVEGHFWLGGNLGSYGEVKGVLKSLSLVKPIRLEMGEVIRRNEHYLNGAAYHVLGAVDYKVPALMGGSKPRAKAELEKALSLGPSDPFNHYYMAEFAKTIGDKARLQSELAALRTLQVAPEDAPELKMVLEKAARDLPHH